MSVRAASPAGARSRVTYFDWLRGAATFAVVVLHMCNKVLTDHPLSELGAPLVLTWTWLQLVLTRWAVPVFLMITGALLLDPARPLGWDRLGRYMARMFAVLLVFCPVYTCVSARGITPAALLRGLGRVFTQGSWDHLWYVYALIGLYLLTPLLRPFVAHASERQQRQVLLALGVTTLVLPTINHATGAGITTIGWVSSTVLYYLLGSYAHRRLRPSGRLTLLGLGSLALGLAGTALAVLVQASYPKWLIQPECPLVALWSLYLFVTAHARLDGRPAPHALAFASAHSLGIYLLHPLPLIVLYRRLWWLPYQTLPPVVFELVVLGIVYGTTLPAASALKRVPGLGRIL